MNTKSVVLSILFVAVTMSMSFGQASCYNDYTGKFKQNGAQPVTDGMQKVVAAVQNSDGNSSCYEGEIMVKNNTIVPPLYLLRENGTHTVVYGKFDQSFYRQAEQKINYSIEQGMSPVFMLIHDQKARLFFTDFLNGDAGAVVKAPGTRKSEPVAQADIEKVNVSAKSIEFKTGKAVLTSGSMKLLDAMAELMNHYPNTKWTIDGYTDNVGKAESNLALSEKRAEAVADYLVKKGVSADNLYTNGYGQENPVADNNTPDGRQQNRRVEIKPV